MSYGKLALAELKEKIITQLKTIYDPEIPVNIYDLGLIYKVELDLLGNVQLQMTLTTPGCPVAQTFPDMVKSAVQMVPGVNEVSLELVWDPPWTQDCMTEAAKLELGLL